MCVWSQLGHFNTSNDCMSVCQDSAVHGAHQSRFPFLDLTLLCKLALDWVRFAPYFLAYLVTKIGILRPSARLKWNVLCESLVGYLRFTKFYVPFENCFISLWLGMQKVDQWISMCLFLSWVSMKFVHLHFVSDREHLSNQIGWSFPRGSVCYSALWSVVSLYCLY